jgi:hypothetical protein
MRYNTLKISVDKMSINLGYIDATARVRTGGRVFRKVYWGRPNGLEEILHHPIKPQHFGDADFLSKIKYLELDFPKNKEGREFKQQAEGLLRTILPALF